MQVNEASISLGEKGGGPYRPTRDSRNFEWPNQHFGTFLKRKECTDELSNTKRTGRQLKWMIVDLVPWLVS